MCESNMNKLEYESHHGRNKWNSSITNITFHTDYIECTFKGRGSLLEACIGKRELYQWILFPDIDKGCTLSNYDDYLWNNEKLSMILGNDIDSATVAAGLLELYRQEERLTEF